jgi:imidazolonepropionase-like amidohydrolase
VNTKPYNDLADLARLSQTRPVWLRVGRLIDGRSDRPIPNANIVFDAHQIQYVGPEPAIPESIIPAQSVPDAAFPDHTILPCLIEAHAHMFLDGAPIDPAQRESYLKQPPASMLNRARQRWPGILRSGVGAVRDAGDRHGVGLALAAECRAQRGKLTSIPHIDSPGAAIHHRGRYGSFMADPIEDHATPAQCVAARVAAGADRIKLLVSGIINFQLGRVTTVPQMSAAEVAALVRAAKNHNRQTFAHASGVEGIASSIEGGVTTVEHGFFITPDQLARMRDAQIGWVPTFAPVQLQIDRARELGWNDTVVSNLKRIIDSHREMLRRASAMQVKIIAGSDAGSCGVPHGIGLLRELSHMESAGLAPMAVLQSATSVSAAALDFPQPIGQIAPGYRSRFIVTPHDPLATVANLFKDKLILFDGCALQSEPESETDGL